jgi:methionyl-tRNA formyltransferase
LTMRVVVAGKNSIAIEVLRAVLQSVPRSAVSVIPNRDDTGSDSWQLSLRAFAAAQGVSEVQLDAVEQTEGVVFLSMEFDRLLKPARFRSDRLYNIHFSRLPAYKGMYTSAWPILNGETRSGVTLHHIDAGIDTGDIIAQSEFPLEPDDTARDLYIRYLERGTALVLSELEGLLGDPAAVPARPQPANGSSYYSRHSIDYSNVRIDLFKTAAEVHRQVRAFTFKEYQLPVIHGHCVTSPRITTSRSRARPGTVASRSQSMLRITTIDYDLELRIHDEPKGSK